ncbi:MAG TPA: GH92 family glycosyl hydrolase [Kofleriaceae bacterium]|nr:GH92 family glycosyl hydrolase [Kofleriaceae bacterium]
MLARAHRSLGSLAVVAAALAACGGAGPRPGGDAGDGDDGGPTGPTEFATSFEDGEPQPAWTSTVETDATGRARADGVTGPASGIRGNVTDRVVAITASGENPPAEIAANLTDGEVTTKWLAFAATGWAQVRLTAPVAVRRYALSSANDAPERDPADWTLEGSHDGAAWTVLDTRTGQRFGARFETRQYELANDVAYAHYRLTVRRTNGGDILQLAELQLSTGDDTPPSATPMRTTVGRGPGGSWNAAIGAGFTGVRALRFAGSLAASGRGYSYNRVLDVDVVVTPSTELSYLIFPDETPGDPRYPSSYAAVDLAFDDGTYLSELDATDQAFARLSPSDQGRSRTLYPGEWNHKLARIGDVAAGKRIDRILVGYDNPDGPAPSFGGWIDDLRISATPSQQAPSRLSDYVVTTRGTNSGPGYSRGNNLPATAVPHGFNFWTPVTDAGSDSWLYHYARMNGADNLPALQALALSHAPSPWMGDRQSFQVMPSAAPGTPDAGRSARALPFRHQHEIARAHYYSVEFENGIRAELAPTDHAAIFRFTFPGNDASLIFDHIDNRGGLTLDPDRGVVTGYSDARSGLSTGASRMFIYATFDRPVVASGRLPGGGGPAVTGYLRFAVDPGARQVIMRIATSLISVDQARKNLELELAAGDGFDAVKERAQASWDARLGIVEVEGASFDQLTTLYSNLYRLFLYPNRGFENTGTADAPVYQYASPVSPATGVSTPTRTGARIVDGKIYVNNGFWDTYRSAWPALALLTPSEAGEMIDGFVQHHRDGGWVSRWSSPGYADLMTGTSSDVAFADAYLKGVTNFDAAAAYDAAVRNATAVPTASGVGRKGLATSIFRGYTPTSTDAGLSWAMAGYLDDFGIANLAAALAAAGGPRRQQYEEEAAYFLDRSRNYVHLFDPAIGFFQGRSADGAWGRAPASYDPRVWGYDYTETNGWNMAFDAPHDGHGLANLYGGRDALAAKLDAFFATPETAGFAGSYGGVIHEMREARDVRMGQLGLSNQPSFHILYMYAYAGQPWKTQALVRDALARLFVGSSIGQGYLGDEDNGATSSWHLFGALGFYPLQVGSPRYVIGSPLFTKATIHLENGKTIVIDAPANSPRNVYVQAVRVNGQPYDKTYLPHDLLVAGAHLEFDMGPSPSSWGTGADAVPPSITTGSAIPAPLRDATARGAAGVATASDGTNLAALFDDTSATRVTFAAANPSVQFHFAAGAPVVRFYTLTSGPTGAPAAWRLDGSTDGATWTTLDARTDQAFPWGTQTRPFRVTTPGAYAYYRLTLLGPAARSLAELELLAIP